MNAHVLIFNLIAPIYGLFFGFQVKKYREFMQTMHEKGYLNGVNKVIDLGFGTGALLKVFADNEYDAHGVEASSLMHRVAKKKLKHTQVRLHQEDVLKGCMQCPDKSYDMAVSSYVIHGLKKSDRFKFYREMNRIAKKRIVLYEHSETPSMGIRIAELLEGGRYFSFIKIAEKELKSFFGNVISLQLSKRITLFIIEPDDDKKTFTKT